MKSDIKRLAIIPSRGGSKRIPQKNIREFCGAPMISHILKTANSAKLFRKIHVSTDSDQVFDVVKELGFEPDFMRPQYLADDETPLMPVLKHVVEEYLRRGESYDEIWMLAPCSPLISQTDLMRASELFSMKNGANPLIAVSKYPAPVEWAFRRHTDGHLTPLNPGAFSTRSQDMAQSYFDTGNLAVFPESHVLSSAGAGTDSEFISLELPPARAVDIDTEEDWNFAEDLYLALNSQESS